MNEIIYLIYLISGFIMGLVAYHLALDKMLKEMNDCIKKEKIGGLK